MDLFCYQKKLKITNKIVLLGDIAELMDKKTPSNKEGKCLLLCLMQKYEVVRTIQDHSFSKNRESHHFVLDEWRG